MAYRNGTYIAFHANGTNFPIASDIKYYNIIKAWKEKENDSFAFVNSHDKTSAVRDTSSKETLARSLKERLNNSKNMLLLLGETTKSDIDWVPFEIAYAVDKCQIPIIVAYLGVEVAIRNPINFDKLWPTSLKERINNGQASCIHIPFKKNPIISAIDQFNHNNFPKGGGIGCYNDEAYKQWGIM